MYFSRDPYAILIAADRAAADLNWLLPGGFQDILLFGSVARGEQSSASDIDLIITVNDHVYDRWQEALREMDPSCFATSVAAKQARLEAASIALCQPFVYNSYHMSPIDLFLLPVNWKSRLDELQTSCGFDDPLFMQNVAKDAESFDPYSDSFPEALKKLQEFESREWSELARSFSITSSSPPRDPDRPRPWQQPLTKKRWLGIKRKHSH